MNWKTAKIEDKFLVTDYVANGSFAALKENVTYKYEPDYAVLIRTTDNTKGWNGDYVYVNKDSYEFLKKSSLLPGDLIIANVGEPGKAFLCPNMGQPMTLGPNSILVRPLNETEVSNKFFYYYTISVEGQGKIQEICSATTQKKFNKTSYRAIEFNLPPLETQKKIASILDAADAYRQKTKALIHKYDELTQSLFLEMFGDPVTNPKGWKLKKVKEFATIVRGSSPRPKGDPRYYGDGVPRLMVADLTRDGFYVTHKIDSLTLEGAKKSRPMEKGELVMAVSGRPGLPAILNVDCCIHDGFAGFKNVSMEYNLFFLCNYFWFYISQVSRRSVGAIFQNITTDDIRNIEVPVIPINLQNQFANRIQEIEVQKGQVQQSLEKAEEMFSSLLQRAFKGELV